MNESELRAIIDKEIGPGKTEWDSHGVMTLVMVLEPIIGREFTDDEVGTLSNWANVKAAALQDVSDATYNAAPIYKCLVLDADNTLWAGVSGEGRIVPFTGVQGTYLDLSKRGVILALASRNDEVVITEALSTEGSVLHLDNFAIVKAGWTNKAESIRSIASDLNIGLDSIVFVDDSPFETDMVTQMLPEVKVVHAPPKQALDVAREVAAMFPHFVDTSKTEQYRALAKANASREDAVSEEDFLRSLRIKVEMHRNRLSEMPRIAELCQKSNQFNVTTRRYDEHDLTGLEARQADIWSLTYADRFGDQGLVGVLIIDNRKVDTFLLSCRILGRGVERAPWSHIPQPLQAEYIPTDKNAQVADLFDRLGLTPIARSDNGHTHYSGHITANCPDWIELTVRRQ
jgi:FkbH-like protein